MAQPTMPPPGGQTPLGQGWSWFRGLPMWVQVVCWAFLFPFVGALLIASPPNPSRTRYATAAAVLVLGSLWWGTLFGEDSAGRDRDFAAEEGESEGSGRNRDVEPQAGASASDEPTEEAPSEAEPGGTEPSEDAAEDRSPTEETTADADLDEEHDPRIEPEGAGWTVVNVVDGDTLDVRNANGVEERVRVIGIDTPERGECGYGEASVALADLVMGEEVSLVAGARDDRDRYDRMLRYIDVGDTDAGRALLDLGLARSRYDSRDGYGRHPREDAYVAADEAMPDITCEFEDEPEPEPGPTQAAPEPEPEPKAEPAPANPWGTSSCDAAYSPCVPPTSEVGDLNCPDIRAVHPGGVSVDLSIGDPHGLDGDKDGHGCD